LIQKLDSGEKSGGTIISTLLQGSQDLSDHAKDQDCRVVIVAGSDTTASSIAGFFYYLTLYPAVYKKLQRTLDEHFPGGDTTYTNAVGSRIPYLDAVIHETLRLQPPVPAGLPRETPPEGLTIDGVFIPGYTTVSVPNYTINRDERCYGSPLEFIPERWTDERPDLIKIKNVFMPFTLGEFTCSHFFGLFADES
jgi:cytochrome P450